ncbi:MAG: shikimate dehydrogenase [Selenomonadaceae bacterium]|nr:shikimate dehydrogenase [Selenomonadaceae bacterium]
MYTGKTRNLGVMGWPIAHSLSPVLQNAAIEEAGLDYAYVALPVEPLKLPVAVEGLRALQFRGFNVTIPHKSAIMPLLDGIDEDARIIGAVNTVVNEDGFLRGYNTDAAGFIHALQDTGFEVAGKQVCVLGAGGAARAVLWALAKHGAARVSIGVRNPEKAKTLVELFRKHVDMEAFHWESEAFLGRLADAGLLVNTTPLGMHPHVDDMPPVKLSCLGKDAVVYDIIYTPAETRLLREAASLGHPVLNGEGMLAGQGAAAFRLWTGVDADVKLMEKVLRKFLEENR